MSSDEDLRLWDGAAERYAEHTGPADSFFRRFRPFLERTLGDVAGRRVLDLGCGHGWLAGRLRAAGASVIGIDGSAALLSRAADDYPGVEFVAHDLATGLPRPVRAVDAVVSHMVLMDVPELDRLVADVRAALTPHGVFVFSLLHPCFFGQDPVGDETGRYRRVAGYLRHERRLIDTFGGHHHYHRPLSWYVHLLTRNGLVVTGLDEPPALPAHDVPESDWTDHERWLAAIPTMLAVSCRPAPAQ